MSVNYVVNQLEYITRMYESIRAFYYQKIKQNKFTFNNLATYDIDYNLLLPSSKYITFLNESQVNAQMQVYINLCNLLVEFINTNIITRSNLIYQNVQISLNSSIAQLNGFALILLKAQYSNIFVYTIPYNMSITSALYQNQISIDTYLLQFSLNRNIRDFNNLQQGEKITLSKN